MPLVQPNDRVKETTATTGTLDVALAGAVSGFQAFSGVLSSGDSCYYALTSSNDWETGQGTYDSGANTLTRDAVLESSNSGAKISLSGTSTIFLSYVAKRAVYKNENDRIVVSDSGVIFNDGTIQTTRGLASGDNVSVLVNDAAYITGSGNVNRVAVFDTATSVSGAQGIEIQTTGDPGLDIFRKSGQTSTLVNIYTENTGVLTVIDENGYIGIGTGDPTYHLQVEGTGDFDTIRFSDGSLQTTAATGYLTSESDTLQTVVDRGSTSTTDIAISGLLTVATGVTLEQNTPAVTTDKLYNVGGSLYFNGSAVDTDTTYAAGSGLELSGTTFNAKTATTSASGITTLTNTIDSTETKALTPKGVNDAGYVVGPGSSTDNAIVRFDGTTGKLVQDSVVTVDDTGKLATPGLVCGSIGIQLGENNYMGFDSVTVTGVTASSPQQLSFLGSDITGTQNSAYLFMVRLSNIQTNETNGSSYFFRKSGTATTSNWEAFQWGAHETAAGESPEIYIDTGEADGGAVKVKLKSANPAGGDNVLAHIQAWRVDRGDNDIQTILPEATFAHYRYGSNTRKVYPIASGNIDIELGAGSSLVLGGETATEILDVRNKAYVQSIYNAVSEPTGSPSIELDLDAGNIFNITLDENKTFSIKSGTDNIGSKFLVNLRQASGTPAGSGYSVTWWSNIKWTDPGTAPALSNSGNLVDTIGFMVPSGNKFYGYLIGTGIYDG